MLEISGWRLEQCPGSRDSVRAVLIGLATLLSSAQAQDTPHLWTRGFGALVVNPPGVFVDFAAEARAPVLRRDGAVFNTTFIGAGARIAASPVHAEYVARASFTLIDILPVTVEGFYATYWESPWGPMPMATVSGQRLPDRRPVYEADRDFSTTAAGVIVSPTFQIAAGPVVAFSRFSFTWITMKVPENPEPWVFDPYRGVVMEPTDRIMDHTSAVLWQPLDGEDKALLRVGPVLRGRVVRKTTDETLQAGLMAQWRPGPTTNGASLVAMVTPYLKDPDFEGLLPNLVLAVSMSRITPFKK